jgi:hypothetical protein
MDNKPPMTRGQKVGAFAIAVICGAALAWLWSIVRRNELTGGGSVQTAFFTILGMVLVVDLPICFLILIGKPPIMTLSPLIPSAEERANWKRFTQRELLDDEAFFQRFYAGTGISKEIPLRLRRLYTKELLIDRVWPEDKTVEFDWELDFGDVLDRVEREFGVRFTKDEVEQIDGSFDSIVRLVAKKLEQTA